LSRVGGCHRAATGNISIFAGGIRVLGVGFPSQMLDEEPEAPGYEVLPHRSGSGAPR